MKERLQKIISQFGIASRRQAEEMLRDGRVAVNGVIAELGASADPDQDQITVDGVLLSAKPGAVYLLLNKPRGYVTTLKDEKGRKHVGDLVRECGCRVYPVGRLDQYSEGLLLMTNDGELTNRLTHPKGLVKKIYHVWVNGFREEQLQTLTSSIVIDGRKTAPAKVRICSLKGESAMLEFTLLEGRNRQIRRLCEAAGAQVTRLKRIQEGKLCLGDLPVGKWRFLSRQEVQMLFAEE